MIRTSSVNGSEEMPEGQHGLAMSIESLIPMDWKEYRNMSIRLTAMRDPDDSGSVRVAKLEVKTSDGDEFRFEPKWKLLIRRIFKIY